MHRALAGERAKGFSVSAREFAAVMKGKISGEEGELAHGWQPTPGFYFAVIRDFLS